MPGLTLVEGAHEPLVVAEIERGMRGVVRFAIATYRGRSYLDIRLWSELELGQGYVPTRRGVTLPLESAAELERAVAALAKAARR